MELITALYAGFGTVLQFPTFLFLVAGVVLGLVVGFIVVALFLPMVPMVESLSAM